MRCLSIAILLFLLAGGCFAETPPPALSFLMDGARGTMDLTGVWQSQPIHGLAFNYPPDEQAWTPERIPEQKAKFIDSNGAHYSIELKELLTPDGTAFKQQDRLACWYKYAWTLPDALPGGGHRVILRFDGIGYHSEVWFNGEKVGVSNFGMIPNSYDVTGLLRLGAVNTLIVGLAGRESLIDLTNHSYIAPNSGVMPAVWGAVSLRLLPAVAIADNFIQTSVREQRISMGLTVRNSSARKRTVRVEALVSDQAGEAALQMPAQSVTLDAGATTSVTLSRGWSTPRLWSPESPVLYYAHARLTEDGAPLDNKTDRFGFREFEVRGKQFFLNGQPIILRRTSHLDALDTTSTEITRNLREKIGQGYNCIRLHLGFNSPTLLDAADRLGMLMVCESGWDNLDGKYNIDHPELWLPAVETYQRALIMEHRNRPSVIMWSLTNETFWSETHDARMLAVMKRLVTLAAATDPTRPQQADGDNSWAGQLPVINIHYPEGTAGVLRTRFPNGGLMYPNDMYWLQQQSGELKSWNASFTWDRPLMIGEYWWSDGDPDGRSSFMGESVYDWEKWQYQSITGSDPDESNDYMMALRRMSDVYRLAGVAGMNPWSGVGRESLPEITVRPLEFHPNAFGGKTFMRKVVVLNDGIRDPYLPQLACRLAVDGRTVWSSTLPVPLQPGAHTAVDIPIACPLVSTSTPATLLVRLCFSQGSAQVELASYHETIYLMPPTQISTEAGRGVALYDPAGRTATALRSLGLPLTPLPALRADNLQDISVLVIGEDAPLAPYKSVVLAFVKNGGRVILLHQTQGAPLTPELPEIDVEHATTRAWKRCYGHPILAGIAEAQLSYWQPDNLLATQTFAKPSTGRFRCLLDAGGVHGMRWSPLVEVPYGQGAFIASQLPLVSCVGQEPLAGRLFANMLGYCQTYQAPGAAPLRVVAGKNDALAQTLRMCGVVRSAGLSGDGPMLIDASAPALSAEELAQLKQQLNDGAIIWLHGFTPDSIGKVAGLFPFPPVLTKIDANMQGLARRADDPIINNLCSYDFVWSNVNIGNADSGYFYQATPTAPIGDYQLSLPTLDAGTVLVAPALLVKVPVGKGSLLFDNVRWENAVGVECDKVSRVVSSLAQNIGAEIRPIREEMGKATLVSAWDAGNVQGATLPNTLPGMAPLTFDGANAPTPVQVDGAPCLRFRQGQNLSADGRTAPVASLPGPYALEVQCALEAPLVGYEAGIVQCMGYQQKGYRLVIGPHEVPCVEIFTGPGPEHATYLSGKTRLTFGRMYTLTVIFARGQAVLLLDGKLDAAIDTPPPAPCTDPVSVGVASGNNYFFNGVIRSIKVYQLAE